MTVRPSTNQPLARLLPALGAATLVCAVVGYGYFRERTIRKEYADLLATQAASMASGKFQQACYDGDLASAKAYLATRPGERATLGGLGNACRGGNIELVKLLLQQPGATRETLLSCLCSASSYGHAQIVRLLLDRGAPAQPPPGPGVSPLQYTAYNGHADCARVLLDHGANIDERLRRQNTARPQPEVGFTPLMLAARYGHMELAKLLVARGADATAKAPDGRTAAEIATQYHHPDIARLFVPARRR